MYLDANILLEILLDRPNAARAHQFIEEQDGQIYISALTAHLVVHFGKAIVDLPILRSFLSDYVVLGLDETDFEWAFTNTRDNDFEDALQLAVAIRNGCQEFVTFDKHLASTYKNLIQLNVSLLH